MGELVGMLKANRTRLATLAVLVVLFVTAVQGMETKDWVITVMRGLSIGMVTFLVAAGLSLILGLMDVLNLAHGEMFMIGAYVGWTVFVRPDTFVDVLPPLLLVTVGFVLLPLWRVWLSRLQLAGRVAQLWPWAALLLGLVVLSVTFARFPIAIWDPEVYAESPITFSLALSQNNLVLPDAPAFTLSPLLVLPGVVLGGVLMALAVAGWQMRKQVGMMPDQVGRGPVITAVIFLIFGLL
ncbi:MAG: hypothetical protein ACE5EY_15620, partial [Anaerolineae bacterium]